MSSRLERLDKATEGMSVEDWRRFESFFMGALSVEVSDEVWDDCLRTAVNFFVRTEKPKEANHVGSR